MKLLPRIQGTECRVCGYQVPALGLAPDDELAWFERFERRPCPNCCGLALGIAGAFVLSALLERRRFA